MRIAKSSFLRYPLDQKFQQNRSISHGQEDRSKVVFFAFLAKIKIFTILNRIKSFKDGQEYIAEILCGLKVSKKLLYLARLRR